MSSCKMGGIDDENPCRYTSLVRTPSGSTNNRWRSLSRNLTTLSSIDGQ